MAKKMTKHGNSLALVIDKPILDMLQITSETLIEMSTNGDMLVIKPIRDEKRQKRLEKSLKAINKKFSPALKKLAE